LLWVDPDVEYIDINIWRYHGYRSAGLEVQGKTEAWFQAGEGCIGSWNFSEDSATMGGRTIAFNEQKAQVLADSS